MKKRYSDEEFISAIETSISIRQALKKLGLSPSGGNYDLAKWRIKNLNIDTSHMKGQRSNEGRKFGYKQTLDNLLIFGSRITSFHLKQRLLDEGIFLYKCYCCGNTTWNEKIIPLELEHINGVSNDNRLENLTLLCPNCHAQTSTYRGKNIHGMPERD
jgi:hypothetical protein